jgi:cobaltochelatase CobS
MTEGHPPMADDRHGETKMNAPQTLAERAAAIESAYPAKALASLCRQHGFTGDENRYTCTTEKGEHLTGKRALAYWLAAASPDFIPEAPEQQTARRAAPTLQPTAAAAQLLEIVQGLAGASLNEDRVREIAQEVAQAIDRPAPILLQLSDNKPARQLPDEHRHPMFEKVCRLVSAGVNVMLFGSAGTGKSHLAEQVAKALDLDYGALHCTAGASESQLLGWLLPVGEGGAFRYVPAQFSRLYKQGRALFLIDEMDAADPNFLMVLNGALANGHLHVPQNIEEPSVSKGERFSILAACNTYGTGGDLIFAGRNQLDGATLDRFYIVHIDYDQSLERAITGRPAKPRKEWQAAPTDPQSVAADVRALADWLDLIRSKAQAAKLRRIVSTRAYMKAAAARAAGIPAEEIRADLLAGWTRDELAKVA